MKRVCSAKTQRAQRILNVCLPLIEDSREAEEGEKQKDASARKQVDYNVRLYR